MPGGRRPMRRARRHGRLDAAQGEVPAVHGAFHAQRALEDAADPQGMGVRRYLDMSRLDDNLAGAN